MKILLGAALAGSLVLTLGGTAFAQSFAPQVPNPTNPFPPNPIATDGTPLVRAPDLNPTLYQGRSAFVGAGPVDGIGNMVGATVGAASGVLGTGLGAAGSVVGGTLGGAQGYYDGVR